MPQDLRDGVIGAIKTVYDPEIPVNIWELGLIYDLQVNLSGDVVVKMTLTAPNCPVAEFLPAQVKERIRAVEGVRSVDIDLVFDPPWDRGRMSDAAKLALGFDLDMGNNAMGRDVVPASRLR